MKTKLLFLLFFLSTMFGYTQTDEFANNRIVLAFNNTKDISHVNQIRKINSLNFLFSDLQISSVQALDGSNTKFEKLNNRPLVFIFDNSIPVREVINQLKETQLFHYVEPDYIGYGGGKMGLPDETIPTDNHFDRQWALRNDGTFTLSPSTVDADIDIELAWDLTTGDPNLIIAVLDSGLRMQHPEFAGRLWTNGNEVSNGSDSDNNGFVDDNDGWDFANNDNNPTDDHGHGTNVSGIIVANGDNGIGYAGVNWQSKLMPLKILDNNNNGLYSWWTAAIYYAVDNGAKIINMSVGGNGFSSAMQSAANYAYYNNVSIFVSMMNFNNNTLYYPAAYSNTVAVGSTDSDDTRTAPFFWSPTSGSNYGSHIDVIAPGNYMYGLSYSSDTNYNSYWGGTSQAAPLVSGICSLMLSINPSLSVDEIRTILRDTAEDQVGDLLEDTVGWDQYYGAGRVNAFSALQQVQLLSTAENDLNSFKVYPNPVNNNLFISSTDASEIKSYKITNVNGQLLKSGVIKNNTISCSFLSQGIYFIELISDSGNNEIKKIIKK